MIKVIKPVSPFDFSKMLRRVSSAGKNNIVHVDMDNQTYKRMVHLANRPVLFQVKAIGSIDEPELEVEFPETLSQREQDELLVMVKRMFSTDIDIKQFYSQFSDHRYIAPLISDFYGVRLVTDPDLFESMVKIITGQQVNLTFAAVLIDRLIDLAGEHIEHESETFSVFPTAENMASLEYGQLRELQFSQRKAEYIIDFARLIASGTLDVNSLWAKSDEEVISSLLPIRGIGRWTIECLLIFAMGRTNVLPAADIGLRNGVRKAWGLEYQPSEEDVRRLAEDWAPWNTYITYYLWESLAVEPVIKEG
ncbi:DNA-3-methyladenine glycosylase 2 [Fictibacillus sp. KIGAM418]|uniref:DNA-3-methyladenine glycosylase II n=1 Tax=Fictibacillus marinisediminis TaxID=2878389 RepID=A0A9X2BCT5_9BACL|nr:DNA-3-methyladenine glycosylase 2 [Fictibacillus marinisediminis]MCK6255985.1 DNA-3-methyladenine glycosylase 2 [Fictibacillus marinisediminis]